MAKVADRVSSTTVLAWGLLTAPVALFKTTGTSEEQTFVKAGPHGAPLERAAVRGGLRITEREAREQAEAEAVLPTLPPGVPGEFEVDRSDPLEVAEIARLPEIDSEDPVTEPISVAIVEKGYDVELEPEQCRVGVLAGEEERFVDLTDELREIRETTKLEEMRVIGFVRREAVARWRITGSYYLGAAGPGTPKIMRLLQVAMQRTERSAVVKWTKRSRQSLGVIIAGRRGEMIVLEMAWAEDLRRAGPRQLVHAHVELTAEEEDTAVELAEAMADASALLDEQEDDRVRLERELIVRAEAGTVKAFKVPERATAPEDEDAVSLLRASLA